MKKITFLMRPHWVQEGLALLRDSGVLHVSHSVAPGGEDIVLLESKIDSLGKAITILEDVEAIPSERNMSEDKREDLAERILALHKETREVEEMLAKLESEYDEALIWGNFDPSEIKALEKAGINMTLFSCPEEALKTLPVGLSWQVITCNVGNCYVAAFSRGEGPQIAFRRIKIPPRSFIETGVLIDEKKKRLFDLEEELRGFSGALPFMKRDLEALRERLEFETVCSGMGKEEGVAYVRGFVPLHQLEGLKKLASKECWGIIVEEPGEEDPVPTLIRHSRLSALFQPVMSFIGITPGYFEYDTNAVFIIFFSLFFAMIVGDGGYGLLLLLSAAALQRFKPSLRGHGIRLFYLLSLSTLLWGALSGNWFGLSGAALPLLKGLIIPGLDSFDGGSSSTVMELCFFIALLHLSAAHIWKGILCYPSLRVMGEAGWVIMLTGIYLLVKGLILKSASIPLALNIVFSGFVIIILFCKQGRGGFLKGVVSGLKSLPVMALDGVGGLSNMVSYLRLFAVGMASKEVAAAFNAMAMYAGFHDVSSIFIGGLILIFGHGVNMLLIAMSVIVHGIRLNILEFSGHMNIEWSGIPYKPFGRLPKELTGTALERVDGGVK